MEWWVISVKKGDICMSDKKALSSSKAATGLTHELVTRFLEDTGEGLLKSPVFVAVFRNGLNKFVNEVGPELQEKFVGLVERRFQADVSSYRIPVNYDAPDAIAKAIKQNRFDPRSHYIPPDKLPLSGKGQIEHEVHEIYLGTRTMVELRFGGLNPWVLRQVIKSYGRELGFKFGFDFCDVLTALEFARLFPDKQKKDDLGTLFWHEQRWNCFLRLHGFPRNFKGQDCSRILDTTHDIECEDVSWPTFVHFLVVPGSLP